MFHFIIQFCVKNKVFIFATLIVLCILGVHSFQKLSIDAVPDITNTQVQINTQVKGYIPVEIERIITFPIENAMNGLPGVNNVRSISKYGISQVTVVFDEGYDIYKARQLISEKLQNIELPESITPKMGPISTGLGEIYHYSLEYKKKAKDSQKRLEQLMELRSLQEWEVKPRLLSVSGVTEVNTIGGFEKKFFIQPKIEKMNNLGLGFSDIEKALQKTNKNVGGGYVKQTAEQFLVQGVGLFQNKEDIGEVIVKRLPTFKVVRIKDIAEIRLDREIRTGFGTVNGEEAVIGTAFMLLGENSRVVSQRVHERLQEIKKQLPQNIKLKTLYDRSDLVKKTLTTVEENLIYGAVLVSFVLLLLVGNLRAALITAFVIPMALLITFILMRYRGVSGNLMSLGALDFGIIIDSAVIVIENCVRRLRTYKASVGRSLTQEELDRVVVDSTSEIRQAAGFGELIVIIAFVPLFALTGVEGKMFVPMAATFMMALFSALILSFTVVPALAATFLNKDISEKEPIFLKKIEGAFRPVLDGALRFRKTVPLLGVGLIVLGGVLFTRLGAEFIPQLDEGDFTLQIIRPANISTDTAVSLQTQTEKVVSEFPQVKDVFSKTGASEISTDPMSLNVTDSFVMLKEKEQWPEGDVQTKKELIAAIKEKVEKTVPAQALLVTQPVELRFNELLEGTKSDVSAKIYGSDLKTLTDLSQKLAKEIQKVPHSGAVESESQGLTNLLRIEPKKEALAKLGASEETVLNSVATALGGQEVGHIYEGVKKYAIVTRLASKERSDLEKIKNIPVSLNEGFTVPIQEVANIGFTETFSAINREKTKRRVAVLMNPHTRDVEGFVSQAKKRVEETFELPAGYYIEWGGSFKNLIQAKKRLAVLVPLSLLVILAMLYLGFQNLVQVLLIFTSVPMALVGGVCALYLKGMPFSISAGVGFMALSGISILNGVVLLNYFNSIQDKFQNTNELIQAGVKARLRPVLMTALTDIFGFLPMMFSAGLGAEVQRPLATVVVGGMVSSTALTLILLPTLYSLYKEALSKKQEAMN